MIEQPTWPEERLSSSCISSLSTPEAGNSAAAATIKPAETSVEQLPHSVLGWVELQPTQTQ